MSGSYSLEKKMATKWTSNNLDARRVGAFRILELVGSHTAKLLLYPPFHKSHPAFDTNLLGPYFARLLTEWEPYLSSILPERYSENNHGNFPSLKFFSERLKRFIWLYKPQYCFITQSNPVAPVIKLKPCIIKPEERDRSFAKAPGFAPAIGLRTPDSIRLQYRWQFLKPGRPVGMSVGPTKSRYRSKFGPIFRLGLGSSTPDDATALDPGRIITSGSLDCLRDLDLPHAPSPFKTSCIRHISLSCDQTILRCGPQLVHAFSASYWEWWTWAFKAQRSSLEDRVLLPMLQGQPRPRHCSGRHQRMHRSWTISKTTGWPSTHPNLRFRRIPNASGASFLRALDQKNMQCCRSRRHYQTKSFSILS